MPKQLYTLLFLGGNPCQQLNLTWFVHLGKLSIIWRHQPGNVFLCTGSSHLPCQDWYQQDGHGALIISPLSARAPLPLSVPTLVGFFCQAWHMGETTKSVSCLSKDHSSNSLPFFSFFFIFWYMQPVVQIHPPFLSSILFSMLWGHFVELPLRSPGTCCVSVREWSVSRLCLPEWPCKWSFLITMWHH